MFFCGFLEITTNLNMAANCCDEVVLQSKALHNRDTFGFRCQTCFLCCYQLCVTAHSLDHSGIDKVRKTNYV